MGNHSTPGTQHAKIVCLRNYGIFILDAKVIECPELGEPYRAINENFCFDLSKCHGDNEGRTFTVQTSPVADVANDDKAVFKVVYSKFYDKKIYEIHKTELDYDINYKETVELSLPADHCMGDSCYVVLTGKSRSWWDSSSQCKANGGLLPSIHSEEQNAFLQGVLASYGTSSAWIGLSRPKPDFDVHDPLGNTNNLPWHWRDGSDVDFLDWAENQPSYSLVCSHECVGFYGNSYCCNNDREYVGEMLSSGEWNDAAPELYKQGLCQIPAKDVRANAPINKEP